jgi:hypothetical protein
MTKGEERSWRGRSPDFGTEKFLKIMDHLKKRDQKEAERDITPADVDRYVFSRKI